MCVPYSDDVRAVICMHVVTLGGSSCIMAIMMISFINVPIWAIVADKGFVSNLVG